MKKILLFLMIFTLALKLPSLFEPDWYTDEAIYLTVGQSLQNGGKLYSDIADNKPPFIYKIAQISGNIFNFKLILLFWSLVTVWIFYRLCLQQKSQYAPFIFAILLTSPFLEGNIANGEVFMLLPILLSLYILNKTSHKQYLLAGFIAGFALLIKFTSLFDIAALSFLVYLNTKSIKQTFSFLASASLPFLTTLFSFAISGNALSFIQNIFVKNTSYISSWYTGNQNSGPFTPPLVFRMLSLTVSCLVFTRLYLSKLLSKHSFFLLVWFCLSLFSATLSGRPYYHYYIQIISPLVLFLFSLNIFAKSKLFPLAICAFLLVSVHPYYKNFLSGNNPDFFPKDTQTLYNISHVVATQTSSEKKLLVWSNDPQIYYLSGRLPAYKYFTQFMIQDWGNMADLMDKVQLYMPIIVVDTNLLPPDQLSQLIQRYYLILYAHKNYTVYVNR